MRRTIYRGYYMFHKEFCGVLYVVFCKELWEFYRYTGYAWKYMIRYSRGSRVFNISIISMRLIYGRYRNRVLFSYPYLSWYSVIWDHISLLSCCVLPSELILLHAKTYTHTEHTCKLAFFCSTRRSRTRMHVVRKTMKEKQNLGSAKSLIKSKLI